MPESQTLRRRADLDYAKGIAILLMIFMHTGNPADYKFSICISAFFMPIFYIVCGMLAAIKSPSGLTMDNFACYIHKRFRQILVPYFVFGSILIAFFQSLHLIAGEPLTVKSQLFRLFTLQGIESMWFLTRYLFAEFLFLFALERQRRTVRALFAIISVAGISVINELGMPVFWMSRFFAGVWIGLVFVYFGFVIEQYQLVQKLGNGSVFFLLGVCLVASYYNGFIGVGALELQNGLLFFANGVGLSVAVLYFCGKIKCKNQVLSRLEILGQYTIVIVCTNNLIIEIIRLLDYKLTGNILIRMGLFGNAVFAGILMGIEYFLIKGFRGKSGILWGRK